jgi:hypothetical protein
MWNEIEEKTKNGEIISSIEMKRELKDIDVIAWYEKHNMQFYPICEKQARLFEKIQAEYTDENFRKNISKDSAWADPIVIALSVVEEVPLITNENKSKLNHIPIIASKFGVKVFNLTEFLADIGFKL